MLATKPIVSFDVDGTIAATQQKWCDLYNKDNGTRHSPADINQYDMSKVFGLTWPEAKRYFDLAWNSDNFKDIGLVHPLIPEIMTKVRRNYEVHVTTSTSASSDVLRQFLRLRGVSYDRINHTVHSTDKLDVIKRLKIAAHVDDEPDLIQGVLEMDRIAFMVDQKWTSSRREEIRQNGGRFYYGSWPYLLELLDHGGEVFHMLRMEKPPLRRRSPI